MRITLAASDLHDALKQSALSARSTLPVLQHVRVATLDAAHVVVEGTDLVARTRITVPAEVQPGDTGSALFEGAKLLAIAAGGGTLVLDGSGEVRRGRSRFTVPTLPVNDFPGSEHVDWQPLQIDPEALARAIAQVDYAPNPGDVRDYCKGVSIRQGAVFGANGHMLARVSVDYDGPSLILPMEGLRHLDGLLHERAAVSIGNVTGASVVKLRVESGSTTVELQLIAAEPIDPTGFVTPPDPAARVTFQRKPLLQALRNFAPFVIQYSKADSGIVLSLREGQMFIADGVAEAANREDVSAALVDSTAGDVNVGLSWRYVQSILGAIDTDEVDWHPQAAGRNVFVPHGDSPDRRVHVVMHQALRA